MSCKFEELSNNGIVNLIEDLNTNLPRSIHALSFVKNVFELNKEGGKLKGKIFAPGGDSTDSTCFVFMDYGGGAIVGTYYSESSEGCDRIQRALVSTNLFKDCNYLLITAVHDQVYQNIGTKWSETLGLKLDHVTQCHMYSVTPEKALQFSYKLPEDVEIRRLREEDAELVNSLWPHRSDSSVHFIKQVISQSSSVGLYRKNDGTLLSWVLKWFYGGLGILQTIEEAKRRGYAQIVVAELSKIMAQDNWHVHATVLVSNSESNPLFNKMGFNKDFVCHYAEFSKNCQ